MNYDITASSSKPLTKDASLTASSSKDASLTAPLKKLALLNSSVQDSEVLPHPMISRHDIEDATNDSIDGQKSSIIPFDLHSAMEMLTDFLIIKKEDASYLTRGTYIMYIDNFSMLSRGGYFRSFANGIITVENRRFGNQDQIGYIAWDLNTTDIKVLFKKMPGCCRTELNLLREQLNLITRRLDASEQIIKALMDKK